MKKIVAFCGYKGCGKTFLADLLVSYLGYKKLSFVGRAKKSLNFLLDCSTPADKNKLVYDKVTYRKAIQNYCEDFVKATFGDDFFISSFNKCLDKVKHRMIVIDDLRFDNEVDYLLTIPDCTVTIIKVVKEGGELSTDSHISEMGISKKVPVFVNTVEEQLCTVSKLSRVFGV